MRTVGLSLVSGLALMTTAGPGSAQLRPAQFLPPDTAMRIVLDEHNRARKAVGLAPLRWDSGLARGASAYAAYLGRIGQLIHSPRQSRPGVGENLSMGGVGWSPQQMVGRWLNERRYFSPGIYPGISRAGSADNLVHYTQMIWPGTTTLGCAMARGYGRQFLVCRYAPRGNRDGRRIP